MGRVFKKHVFPNFKAETLIKHQMNGLDDPSLSDYQLLSVASLSKPECKEERFENEYIKSFLNAAKLLACEGACRTARPGIYVLFEHSYPLPVLYLCRHCVELSIKRAVVSSGGEAKSTHDLERLWNAFSSLHPGSKTRDDRHAMKWLNDFAIFFHRIDPTGTKLRYSHDRNGFSQQEPAFLDSKEVVRLTDLFVEQLELLNAKNNESQFG